MSPSAGAAASPPARLVYPTPRALALGAVAIAVAIGVGLAAPDRWPMGFAAGVFVALAVLLDAALARGPSELDAEVGAPAVVEQGGEARITVRALVHGAAPRALEGALQAGERVQVAPRTFGLPAKETTLRLRAVRRGRTALGPLQLRWTGPLGLARRALALAPAQEVLVTPDLAPARAASRALGADAMGGPRLDARLGQGGEFRALRAYAAGDDRRLIDWKRSASRGALLVKEFQLEQNHPVVLAIDCGRSMVEPIGSRPRVDHALSAALALAYAGLAVGDRIKLCGFDARLGARAPFVSGRAGFSALQAAGARLDYSPEATNFTLALHTIAARLDRRSLVVMFTEFTDSVGAELMLESVARLVRRHVVLFVVFRDAELEGLVANPPSEPQDVSRAVVAATLLRERAEVLERLRRLGVRPVETTPERMGGAVIDAYIDLKRRELRMTAAALKSRVFREAREEDWARLERLLARLERGSLRQLSDDELIALPALYRSALSSLSTARAVSLDLALTDYLESLCTRAYFAIYGVRTRPAAQVAAFFRSGWPEAVRRLWRETAAAAAITVLGAVVGYLLVRAEPDWFYAFVDRGLAQGRGPEAGAPFLRETLYKSDRSGLAVLASFLFTHNAQVAIYAFALGFALCVPTALIAATNGATLGAFVAVYDAKGLAPQLWGWLLIHGTTELFAVTLAAAAGLRLGVTMAFPGDRSRADALAEEGRRAAVVMAGVVVMLAAAGLLEGFARQMITADPWRYTVAATMALAWLAYFYGPALCTRMRGATALSAPEIPRPGAALPADRRTRPLVTPEGVDLRLQLGAGGRRAAAFLIDVAILLGVMIGLTLVCALSALGAAGRGAVASQLIGIVWLVGFFALRNGYFLGFELSPRAATIGKRAVGLRVASRDGARLTADAVFARNAMREVELFLPLGFAALAASQQQPLLALAGLGWTLAVLLLPLFNRDGLRAGDLIAGTWVVCEPRRVLRRDMAASGEALAPRFAFTAAQLDAYGERELQVLEEVLRRGHSATVREVAARIRAKIGWTTTADERDLEFLDAFYAAERRKLEADLLFGRRRRDKHDRR